MAHIKLQISMAHVTRCQSLYILSLDAGKYIIFSYRFFSMEKMINNTPIIIDEIGKVKNQQAYTIVVL